MRRAIRSKPGFSISHMMLAAALVTLGRIDEAKVAAERVLALQPNFSSAHSAPQSVPCPNSPHLSSRRCALRGCRNKRAFPKRARFAIVIRAQPLGPIMATLGTVGDREGWPLRPSKRSPARRPTARR